MNLLAKILPYQAYESYKSACKWYSQKKIASSPFYKAFPYQGNIPLSIANRMTVVDDDLKIFFHRIPKCANSSLTASIAQIKFAKEFGSDHRTKNAIKRILPTPADMTRSSVADLDNYYKFTVVRNPYSRVLSAYLSKVVGKYQKNKSHHLPNTLRSGDTPPDFVEFCKYLDTYGPYENHHWYPQSDYLLFPVSRYDFIAKLENINQDFATILKKISNGYQDYKFVEEDPSHKTSADEKMKAHYNRQAYDIVFNIYKDDFENFGYDRISSL